MTPAVAQILGVETPRVWSFIVTIFGDLARHDDRYISSRTLNRLTAEIGVKPEATRVALYRLRKEDWLESTKFGRESHYRLTKKGCKQKTWNKRGWGVCRYYLFWSVFNTKTLYSERGGAAFFLHKNKHS